MKPALIVYATREGHTRHISAHIAQRLADQNRPFVLVDADHTTEALNLARFSVVILAASLHAGKHEREMVRFVRTHLSGLQHMETLFLSVSLSETTVENLAAPPEERAEAKSDVQQAIDEFLQETCWHPTQIAAVAGALLFSRYNFVLRFLLKRIAKKAGVPADTSRDYEFTDWHRLDQLIDHFVFPLPRYEPAEASLMRV
jgi:menaquinone-dependent protoporphyrinogen oxidase